MTNYLIVLTAVAALSTGACSAAESSTPLKATAPKPAPAAAAAAKVAAAPAGTSVPAGLPRYAQAPGSSLTFSFVQAGAESKGSFKQFATELGYDEKNLAGSSLKVTVQIGSLETQDKDRNDTLAGADLFDVKKFPVATYAASALVKGAHGVEAVGKLTLHGVTKDLRVPLTIATTATGLTLAGETTIKRLDYGVGQGDWKSTEWVGDEVKLQYKVVLTKAAK
jgi:polyisoprenoid-binding protein YceI